MFCLPMRDTKPLAKALLNKYDNDLTAVLHGDVSELTDVSGIGTSAAEYICAIGRVTDVMCSDTSCGIPAPTTLSAAMRFFNAFRGQSGKAFMAAFDYNMRYTDLDIFASNDDFVTVDLRVNAIISHLMSISEGSIISFCMLTGDSNLDACAIEIQSRMTSVMYACPTCDCRQYSVKSGDTDTFIDVVRQINERVGKSFENLPTDRRKKLTVIPPFSMEICVASCAGSVLTASNDEPVFTDIEYSWGD